MDRPDWLPEPLNYVASNNNWKQFLQVAQNIFKTDFLEHTTEYNGRRVEIDTTLIYGYFETFRHIVEGKEEKDLIENQETISRCERIIWISPIIKNITDSEIVIWTEPKRKGLFILLWLEKIESCGYLVVLRKAKNGRIFLETGYPTTNPHTQRKKRKKYSAYISSKRRP